MSILDTQLPFGAKLLKLLDRAPSGRFQFFALLLPGNDVPQVSPRNPGSLRKSPFFPRNSMMRIPMKLLVKTRPSNTREFGYCGDRKHNEMGTSEPQRRAVRILAPSPDSDLANCPRGPRIFVRPFLKTDHSTTRSQVNFHSDGGVPLQSLPLSAGSD